MAKIERRQHTEAFKRRMVRLVLNGARNVEQIAGANKLSPSMLHTWKRDERFGGDPKLYPPHKRVTSDENLLASLPRKAKGNSLPRPTEKHWKYCPNCGERLK